MLLTPLAFESNIAVRRTQVSSSKSALQDFPERVELTIVDEGDVRVNRTVVPRAQLESTLRPLLAGEAPPLLVVSCANAVSHGTFVNVLDEAKQCGAR